VQIEATKVIIDDQMDVTLSVTFECVDGNCIAVSRFYRFDSDHQCMGPACFWHHRGDRLSPHWLVWGGPDRLRWVELQRRRLVAELSSSGGPHPEGLDVVEVGFSLPDDKFCELRTALCRCFQGFSWFAETITEPAPAADHAMTSLFHTECQRRGVAEVQRWI
jgi:hypothetical protein